MGKASLLAPVLLAAVASVAATACRQSPSGQQPSRPVREPLPPHVEADGAWLEVAAGYLQDCAIAADRTMWCWGYNGQGQVGDGTTTDRRSPARAGGLDGWTAVTTGDYMGCGLRQGGEMWCWGDQMNGMPNGSRTPVTRSPGPALGPGAGGRDAGHPLRFDAIGIGDGHACGLSGGQAWCWGNDKQIGRASPLARMVSQFGPLPIDRTAFAPGVPLRDIAVGSHHTCVAADDGRVACWGWNDHGQAGTGQDDDKVMTPTPVDLADVPAGTRFTSVAAGAFHACALSTDGEAWCWGWNRTGCLGTGDLLDRGRPARAVPAGATPRFVSLQAAYGHTCALDADGEAWCWGDNGSGQAAPGRPDHEIDRPSRVFPEDAAGHPLFSRIAPGTHRTCAIATDGRLWCWGAPIDTLFDIGHMEAPGT
jgi:alpha-tubulin suppressor-like RCC1 family protein